MGRHIQKFNRKESSVQQCVDFKLNSWVAGSKQVRNCDSSYNVQLTVELHAA